MTDRTKGIVALVALTGIYAVMGVFARMLSDAGLALLQQVYLRVCAGALFGMLFFGKSIRYGRLMRAPRKEWALIVMRAVSGYLFGVVLFSKAMIVSSYVSVSLVGAIPVSSLLGWLILKERMTGTKAAYLGLSFIGALIISLRLDGTTVSFGFGEVLMFISAFFFAFSYVTRKWHGTYFNNKEITFLTVLCAGLIVLAISLIIGERTSTLSWMPLIAGVVLGGLLNIANVFLSNYGFEKVESVVAGNILMLETVFATLVGVVLYREMLGWREVLGGALILMSIYRMNRLT